jgi:ribosomal protein S24E
MELVIKEEKENPFFKRKDLRLEIKHPNAATPSKKELMSELAKKFSVSEEQVLIDYIFTKKGISESIAKVKILEEKPKPKEIKKEEKIEAQTSETK